MVAIGKSFHYFHSAHKSGRFIRAEGEVISYTKKFGSNKQYTIKKIFTRDLITDVDCRPVKKNMDDYIKRYNASLVPKEPRSLKKVTEKNSFIFEGKKYTIIKKAPVCA